MSVIIVAVSNAASAFEICTEQVTYFIQQPDTRTCPSCLFDSFVPNPGPHSYSAQLTISFVPDCIFQLITGLVHLSCLLLHALISQAGSGACILLAQGGLDDDSTLWPQKSRHVFVIVDQSVIPNRHSSLATLHSLTLLRRACHMLGHALRTCAMLTLPGLLKKGSCRSSLVLSSKKGLLQGPNICQHMQGPPPPAASTFIFDRRSRRRTS